MFQDLVYDVGLHNGDDSAYYLHRGYRVVAIDANPQACANARQRFPAELEDGRLTIVNAGITAQPGPADFWICETHPEWSSFDRRIAARDGAPHHGLPVPCRTFADILEQYGVPYYLKLDVEGSEPLCLEGLWPSRDRPKYISTELGELEEPLRKLIELGYTGFKCLSQYTFLPLQNPPTAAQRRAEFWDRLLRRRTVPLRLFRRAIGQRGRKWLAGRYNRTRRTGAWLFPPGSSGPFGEDTLGAWLTAEQMRETHQYYRHRFEGGQWGTFWRDTPYSFWADLHARRDG